MGVSEQALLPPCQKRLFAFYLLLLPLPPPPLSLPLSPPFGPVPLTFSTFPSLPPSNEAASDRENATLTHPTLTHRNSNLFVPYLAGLCPPVAVALPQHLPRSRVDDSEALVLASGRQEGAAPKKKGRNIFYYLRVTLPTEIL